MSRPAVARPDKPQLSFWQIWNMCFGFLGIQFGFALQNANAAASSKRSARRWTRCPGCGSPHR